MGMKIRRSLRDLRKSIVQLLFVSRNQLYGAPVFDRERANTVELQFVKPIPRRRSMLDKFRLHRFDEARFCFRETRQRSVNEWVRLFRRCTGGSGNRLYFTFVFFFNEAFPAALAMRALNEAFSFARLDCHSASRSDAICFIVRPVLADCSSRFFEIGFTPPAVF